jgi:hypothetical protein
MKLWRGQPDHDHWKSLLSARDKAKAVLGMAAVSGSVAFASAFSDQALCESVGRLVCSAVRGLAFALGTSIRATEVAVWAGIAVLLVLAGIIQWRRT